MLILAFVIIASKIPTSACHCHEKRNTQQTDECPFKKLRQLSASLLVPEPLPSLVLEFKSIEILSIVITIVNQLVIFSFQARAPPAAA